MATSTFTPVYASASDANVRREYELTFRFIDAQGQSHTTVTWAGNIADANAEIAERIMHGQPLLSIREVYCKVIPFKSLDLNDELLKR